MLSLLRRRQLILGLEFRLFFHGRIPLLDLVLIVVLRVHEVVVFGAFLRGGIVEVLIVGWLWGSIVVLGKPRLI